MSMNDNEQSSGRVSTGTEGVPGKYSLGYVPRSSPGDMSCTPRSEPDRPTELTWAALDAENKAMEASMKSWVGQEPPESD